MKNDALETIVMTIIALGIIIGLIFATSAFLRYQLILDARNQVNINEIKIKQTEQMVKVEQQKADIRVIEAKGIAKAQEIINATLTDKYLQHEAIQAQEKMASSPNHSTIYIPSGQNGIPLVKTIDENIQRHDK